MGDPHPFGSHLVHNWKDAYERALAYLRALDVREDRREALALEAVQDASASVAQRDAIAATLDALRGKVVGAAAAGDAYLRWRVGRAVGNDEVIPIATPEMRRRPMGYQPVGRAWRRHAKKPGRGANVAEPVLYGGPLRKLRSSFPWTRVAHRRRLLLVLLVLVPTFIASAFMADVLPFQGRTWLERAIVVVFGVLFGWVSIGFWTALFGFLTLMRGRDRFAITHIAPDAPPAPSFDGEVPTAVIMPIANEPVDRVFAGLRAIYRSIERTGQIDRFHFFVLSDSNDPDVAIAEEIAWFAWCKEVGGFGRIFYRRRRVRIERKSGNVADFCRRWGARYRYMITLDADSVMAGTSMVRMVELMEQHPHVGMIQTAAAAVNRRSLFARIQQFASHVYGPMFTAGLHWWQLGDGQYWGHNTIIRIEPFMDHCGLPRLPGREPLGGEILSHDFVEAALMGRAGWGIWLAYDLGGSWEEVPSGLLEEMSRDRRWCQGNLQHLRLVFTEGLFGAHRALFLNGVFSYVSAALWFAFLSLSTIAAIYNVLREPDYFPNGPSLFPQWPVWRPDWAMSLMAVVGVLLFLPKVLAIILIWLKRRESKQYGGLFRLLLSVVLEVVTSSLLAPIRMVFHTRFVLTNLLGRTVVWTAQGRDDADTSWRVAVRQHGIDTIIAIAWGAGLYWLSPAYFWWVTPIIGALILSVPVSVLLSRVSLGDGTRRLGLFRIPEEINPPPELIDLVELQAESARERAAVPPAERAGFVRAIVDPYVNALHRWLLRGGRRMGEPLRAERRALIDRALADGPSSLTPKERRVLLMDPEAVDEMHARVWAIPDRVHAAPWGRPGSGTPAAVD